MVVYSFGLQVFATGGALHGPGSRRTERIVFITTKYYHGQDSGRVVIRAAPLIARGQNIGLALARAGRHDFRTATTATLATAALTANVALSVTIVLP